MLFNIGGQESTLQLASDRVQAFMQSNTVWLFKDDLVGGLEHLFPHKLGMLIPIDIFSDGYIGIPPTSDVPRIPLGFRPIHL